MRHITPRDDVSEPQRFSLRAVERNSVQSGETDEEFGKGVRFRLCDRRIATSLALRASKNIPKRGDVFSPAPGF